MLGAAVLRCYDSLTAFETLAALFDVKPDDLAAALLLAAQAVEADQYARYPHKLLVRAVAATLRGQASPPARIRYFHDTRIFDPSEIVQHDLLPLSQLIDGLWDRIARYLRRHRRSSGSPRPSRTSAWRRAPFSAWTSSPATNP